VLVSLPKQPVQLWPTQHPISVFTPVFSPCFFLFVWVFVVHTSRD